MAAHEPAMTPQEEKKAAAVEGIVLLRYRQRMFALGTDFAEWTLRMANRGDAENENRQLVLKRILRPGKHACDALNTMNSQGCRYSARNTCMQRRPLMLT